MAELAPSTRPPQARRRVPRRCGTVDGVEFWLREGPCRDVRCVITDGALERHYGATDDPTSWLSAFLRHRGDIEKRALAAAQQRADVHVVLLVDPTGDLKAAAGRCIA